MTVSRDGQFVVTACEDHRIRLWKLDGPRSSAKSDAAGCAISSVALSSDSRRVLTACADNKVRLWDLSSGAEIHGARAGGAQDALIDTGRNAVWSAIFSPDGSHIATAGGNDAKLWQIDNGREVLAFSPHGAVAGAAFSPDGQHVATCSWDGTIKMWNPTTGSVELKFVASPDKYVNSIMFSPDGLQLLSASDDNTAKVWDAKTGKLLLSLPAGGADDGHSDSVRSARFSQDGKRVVTGSSDKTARVWDLATGRSIAVLKGHDWDVLAAVFSADGTKVMTGSEDKTVASGMWRRGKCCTCCKAIPRRSPQWRSRPTVAVLPREARTTPSNCGTPRPARKFCTSSNIRRKFPPLPSRPTASYCSPAAATARRCCGRRSIGISSRRTAGGNSTAARSASWSTRRAPLATVILR